MIRHGYPVPGIHWLFWNRPRQTPVAPFHSSSASQLIETTSSERSRQDDFRPTNLVNQLVRHELFAIDVNRDREEEEHHPHKDGHVGVRLGVREPVQVLDREDDGQDAEPNDPDDEPADCEGPHRAAPRRIAPDQLGHGRPFRMCSRWPFWWRLEDLMTK